ETAGKVFELLAPFAGYGFNKCHAAAYSVLAYQTAYLKANFPAEFMAANLSNEIHSTDKDKLSECIDEAKKMGLAIDPPDINRSDKLFSVVGGRIIYGFLGIKGLGDGPADEIVKCRRDGPYRDFMDFLNRIDIKAVGKKTVELLIQTGAFDTMGQSRETLLGNLEKAVDYAQSVKDEAKYGQSSLFGDTEEKLYPDFAFEPFPDKSREEKLRIEKELTGFYLSGHPMDGCRRAWETYVKLDLGNLEGTSPGPCVLIGILKNLKPITSKGGKSMAFATLADFRGELDLVFFEETWMQHRDSLADSDIIALKGKLDTKRGKPALQVEAVLTGEKLKIPELLEGFCAQPLDKYRETWEHLVKLDLGNIKNAREDEYTLVGLITSLRIIKDKNDKTMAFGSLRDFRGDLDLVFFAKTWETCQKKIVEGKPAALKGRLDTSREKPGFKVSSVLDLERLGKKVEKMAERDRKPEDRGAGPAWAANTASAGSGALAGPAQAWAANTAADTGRALAGPAQAGVPAANAAPAGGGAAGEARQEAPRWRELHIRLDSGAARRDEDLLPLRDELMENPGPCQVFIHVPLPEGAQGGETVIRTASQIGTDAATASIDALRHCLGVAEVWGA
ncbi:MAG: DNA polymerase III subunit alpha, partial [Treponema sp.]|nr:DNA polymerase III subunit alpha [Treponema sp.]